MHASSPYPLTRGRGPNVGRVQRWHHQSFVDGSRPLHTCPKARRHDMGVPLRSSWPRHHGASGRTSLERLVEAYARQPAENYRLSGKGRLEVGYDADIVIVDPDERWQIRNEDIVSRAGWTPYGGREVRGKVRSVLLRGKLLDHGADPDGRFIPGPGMIAKRA
ncbi:MAG TPA: hypothetical protein EYQ31_10375 [Candidatus Handelsmanbacteria bacterium]|nr:hypothetical protein [Candidatus Handelsmanbacteria bacterium]